MNAPQHGTLSAAEERQNATMLPNLTGSLKPEAPKTLQMALSQKQNFAMVAEQMFVHALNRTVWGYRHNYIVVDQLLSSIRNVALESIATPDGIGHITRMVFEDAAMREFIFTAQVQFWSQFSEFHQHWTDLVGNLAATLTNTVTDQEVDEALVLIPKEITERQFKVKEMKDLLLANNWLIVFILIALWGRTYTYDELRALGRRNASLGAA